MSGYVITGGSEPLTGELGALLRAEVSDVPGGSLDAWVHIVPSSSDVSVRAALELAERHLPSGAGATFIAVVPVWGVLGAPADEPAELEAAAARALVRSRMEGWAASNRRLNIVAYGALDTGAVPGLRPAQLLEARTPMHRRASLQELADAIDFLASADASYVNGSELLVDGGWTAYSWFHPARDL